VTDRDQQTTGRQFRSGYVALLGAPNAGKSTLLNRLVGRRVSIVAPRPQTTRHRVLGILNDDNHQALFLDTPGILDPKYKLQELMEKEIDTALRDADVLVLLLDALRPGEAEGVLSGIGHRKPVVAVNKIDRVPKEQLLPLVEMVRSSGIENVFLISALKGDGVDELKTRVLGSLPEGEPFYPPDMVSERPERFFVAEMVREAIFNRYAEEIPYSTAVAVQEFKEREGRKDFIRAIIYVERQSQKKILIGKNGEALKRVGAAARRNIEEFLGRPVYLELWVKVAEDWRRNEFFIRENVYRP
jgi:GTP-binding protein Era